MSFVCFVVTLRAIIFRRHLPALVCAQRAGRCNAQAEKILAIEREIAEGLEKLLREVEAVE
jgi:hypothetical protein